MPGAPGAQLRVPRSGDAGHGDDALLRCRRSRCDDRPWRGAARRHESGLLRSRSGRSRRRAAPRPAVGAAFVTPRPPARAWACPARRCPRRSRAAAATARPSSDTDRGRDRRSPRDRTTSCRATDELRPKSVRREEPEILAARDPTRADVASDETVGDLMLRSPVSTFVQAKIARKSDGSRSVYAIQRRVRTPHRHVERSPLHHPRIVAGDLRAARSRRRRSHRRKCVSWNAMLLRVAATTPACSGASARAA